MSDDVSTGSDYLKKFSYRPYNQRNEPRYMRILQIIRFEVVSTWHRSTFGKVLIVLTLFTNLIGIIVSVAYVGSAPNEVIRDSLNNLVANYLCFGDTPISAGPNFDALDLSMNIGVLLIILFGVSGSGLFADDKQGKVIEVYLTRLTKQEYIAGKVGSIIVYINIFLGVPLLIMGVFFVNGLGKPLGDYLDFFGGILLFSILASIVIGLFILVLSSMMEKRAYASMLFFLIYLMLSLLAQGLFRGNSSMAFNHEFFLLASPSDYFVLLAYVCLGDYKLGLDEGKSVNGTPVDTPFKLNDGMGLEYFHVWFYTLGLIILFSTILYIKIKRMTTEEL